MAEVSSKKGSTVRHRFVVTRDQVGNPTQIVRSGAIAETQTFTYDANDRILSVCFQASCPGGTDPKIGWTYNQVGNRLTETRATGTVTSAYDAADQLTAAGATGFTYDQNGNQLTAGARSFTYDLANRTKTTVLSGTTTTYTYDGDGKRLQSSTGTAASAKTNFLWDVTLPNGQLAVERNGSNVLQRRYTYGLQRLRQANGTASYYAYDALGTVAGLLSDMGGVQRSWAYEPYGTIRTSTGTSPTNFLNFVGEYLDPTGLYHLRARQYDPTTGRFTGSDPLERSAQTGAISSYAYADLRPTLMTDPSGLLARPLASSDSQIAAASAVLEAEGLSPSELHDDVVRRIQTALNEGLRGKARATMSRSDNTVPRASFTGKNPDNNGYPDLLLWADSRKVVLVWEFKISHLSRAKGIAQVQHYVQKIQQDAIYSSSKFFGYVSAFGFAIPSPVRSKLRGIPTRQGLVELESDDYGLERYRLYAPRKRPQLPEWKIPPEFVDALVRSAATAIAVAALAASGPIVGRPPRGA